MMKVELLTLLDMTPADAKWLAACALRSWRPIDPMVWIDAARDGYIGIYRLSGDGIEGIFVLEPKGDCADILALAGKKFLQHFAEVHKIICDTAKGCGCTRVSGVVARPALLELYEQHTAARPVATIIVEDLI